MMEVQADKRINVYARYKNSEQATRKKMCICKNCKKINTSHIDYETLSNMIRKLL